MAIVCQWFRLKIIVIVSWFGPQNQGRQFGGLASKPMLRFGDLDFKITAMVFWFGSQNQGEVVCRFAPQN
jgi:hypothetical protein